MTGHPLINAILTASPENPLDVPMSTYNWLKEEFPAAHNELKRMIAERSAILIPDIPQPMAAPVARGY